MRKFISTLTTLAMTATLAAGTLAAPIMANANGSTILKTLELKVDKSTVDVSAGDAKVWASVYVDESVADIRLAVARLQLEGGLLFTGNYINPVPQLNENKPATLLDGTAVSTKGDGLFFAGTLRNGVFTARGDSTVDADPNTTNVGFNWSCDNGYAWLGTKSNDYPMLSFEILVPAGTPVGTYNVKFDETNKSAPGQDKACATAVAEESSARGTIDTLDLGGLALKNTTITVQNGGAVTTAPPITTAPPVTTAAPIGTTTPGGDVIVAGNLNLKVNEEKFTAIAKGEEILVPISVIGAAGGDPWDTGIMGADIALTYDRTMFKFTDIDGCRYGSLTPSPAANYEANGGQRFIISNSTEGGINCTVGQEVIVLVFEAIVDVPEGVYPIAWNPDSRFINTAQEKVSVAMHNGFIQVGDSTPTQPTVVQPTVVPPTTAATQPTTSSSGGTVLYGDANVNGVVNIADVVCLNKSIANPTAYALTAQGKINADVNRDGNQNATDAGYIIRFIIKDAAVTFPVA